MADRTAQERLYADDLQIQAFLDRYGSQAVLEYGRFLKQIQDSIIAELSTTEDDATRHQLDLIKRQITGEFQRITKTTIDNLRVDMTETASTRFDATVGLLVDVFGSSAIVGQTTFASLPREAVLAITDPDRKIRLQVGGRKKVYNPSEEIVKITGANAEDYRRAVSEAVVRGTGNREIMKELETILDVKGSKANAQVQAVARTAMADAMKDARTAGYDQLEDDVITGWMWNATLDNRTTLGCMELNGSIRKKQNDFPPIPRHFNCRSVLTPVTDFSDLKNVKAWYHIRDKRTVTRRDGVKQTKFKNADTGQTELERPNSKQPESLGDVWFRKMPDIKILKDGKQVNWKQEYLGKEKYRLYTEYGLSFSDLVRGGKPLTIKQIRVNLGLE